MFELAIYSWKRCKRLVLNKENKGKEQICLSRTEYKIHEDVILELKQEGPEAMLSIASGQNLVSDGELVLHHYRSIILLWWEDFVQVLRQTMIL